MPLNRETDAVYLPCIPSLFKDSQRRRLLLKVTHLFTQVQFTASVTAFAVSPSSYHTSTAYSMKLQFNCRTSLCAALVVVLLFSFAFEVRATKDDAKTNLLAMITLFKGANPKLKDRRAYRTGAIKEGFERTLTEALQGGTTYKIMAIGCDKTKDIDIKVYDAAGTLVGEDVKDDNYPVADVAPPTDGTYTVKIQMLKTDGTEAVGHFAYQVFYLAN